MSDSIENFNKSVNADDKEVTKISFLKRRKSILIAVALILVFALVVYLNFGGSFDSAVENYVNANYNCDFDSAVNILPEEAFNYMLQGLGITKEAYYDQIKKTKEDLKNAYIKEYGEDYTVSFNVVRKEKYNSERFGDLKEGLKELGITNGIVSTAYDLDVDIFVSGKRRSSEFKENLIAVKINYKWYIIY